HQTDDRQHRRRAEADDLAGVGHALGQCGQGLTRGHDPEAQRVGHRDPEQQHQQGDEMDGELAVGAQAGSRPGDEDATQARRRDDQPPIRGVDRRLQHLVEPGQDEEDAGGAYEPAETACHDVLIARFHDGAQLPVPSIVTVNTPARWKSWTEAEEPVSATSSAAVGYSGLSTRASPNSEASGVPVAMTSIPPPPW